MPYMNRRLIFMMTSWNICCEPMQLKSKLLPRLETYTETEVNGSVLQIAAPSICCSSFRLDKQASPSHKRIHSDVHLINLLVFLPQKG